MKNLTLGILVFCVAVATLWVVSPYRTAPNNDREPPLPELIEEHPAPTGESLLPPTATPATSDPDDISPEPPGAVATAPIASETADPRPAPPPEVVPATEPISQQADDPAVFASVDYSPPPTGWGLLTDTGETEENRIDNPNAAMVIATIPRKTKPVPAKIPAQAMAKADHQEAGSIAAGDLPFSVLLETYDNREYAQKGVALYGKKGIAAYAVKVDLGDVGIKYRLFCGTFATAKMARAFIDHRSLPGKLVKHTPFTAAIGVFTDHNALTDVANQATAVGAFPYVLVSAAGPLHLIAGAFYTKEGAEHQCRELTDSGLPCTVAPRSTATMRQTPTTP